MSARSTPRSAVFGKEAMAANVPYIQPVLVPRETRKGAKGVKKTFDALRAAVARPPTSKCRCCSNCGGCRAVRR